MSCEFSLFVEDGRTKRTKNKKATTNFNVVSCFVLRYINIKILNTRLMAKIYKFVSFFFLILYYLLLASRKKNKQAEFVHNIYVYFFRNITCCCDLEISVHIFIFMCFMIFVFSLLFFRHHPHPRSISKLLTEVSVLIIKMCLDFFIASSICFFFLLLLLLLSNTLSLSSLAARLLCGVCEIGIKGLQIEWVNLWKGFIEIDDSNRYKR